MRSLKPWGPDAGDNDGSTFFIQITDPHALVTSIKVDHTLLQGQCNPPRLCARGVPSESLAISGPTVCEPVCGEWHACAAQRDVSNLAIDGRLSVTIESGNLEFTRGGCDGNVLHARIRVEGTREETEVAWSKCFPVCWLYGCTTVHAITDLGRLFHPHL